MGQTAGSPLSMKQNTNSYIHRTNFGMCPPSYSITCSAAQRRACAHGYLQHTIQLAFNDDTVLAFQVNSGWIDSVGEMLPSLSCKL